ncbi:hypothetical protein PUN28_003478 [Cardiocondyla obscurior]|uniref:Uncharacterized protein n=1 Tax=Cardiocondyla obscurior TaxID=286306 RepID=A0AAW2GJ58_9HYME
MRVIIAGYTSETEGNYESTKIICLSFSLFISFVSRRNLSTKFEYTWKKRSSLEVYRVLVTQTKVCREFQRVRSACGNQPNVAHKYADTYIYVLRVV